MKIALLHNARPDAVSAALPDDAFEEYDSASTLSSIADALRRLGVEVTSVVADARLPWSLSEGRFDFVFNMAEGEGRRCREAVPAAVCELLGLPFTGSDAVTLGITLDKALAKRVVFPDVPVPRGVVIASARDEETLSSMRYPAIVKPNDEGSSKGIRNNPIADDPTAAAERCRWLRQEYGCPALVEEYLPGAEVTVGVAGNGSATRILGSMEMASATGLDRFVYSLEAKRDYKRQVAYFVPPRLTSSALARLDQLALAAYRLLGCRDIARMDFRLDSTGEPHFIECNPIPGLNPETGDIVLLSRPTISYDTLVQGILRDAIDRQARLSGGSTSHATQGPARAGSRNPGDPG